MAGIDWQKLNSAWKSVKFDKDVVERNFHVGLRVVFVVFCAYVLAATTSSFFLSILTKPLIRPSKSSGLAKVQPKINTSLKTNYRTIRKSVLGRNIFNSEGIFPDESDKNEEEEEKPQVFDARAPCQKSSLPLELVGTIYLTPRINSLAIVKERGYSEADIYKIGDVVIGHEEASIVDIERQRLVVNNRGAKECFELEKNSKKNSYASLSSDAGREVEQAAEESSGGNTILLEASYIEDQLGPGFANILNKARLVPNAQEDGSIDGFRIFAIDKSSLFGRIGLQNNDVIMSVNEISLKQPEQGFALYQIFQDARDIAVKVKRGDNPITINVRVK